MKKKIPIGTPGASGVIGQSFLHMPEHHPWFGAVFFHERKDRVRVTAISSLVSDFSHRTFRR